jgi:hypothetical protein
MVDYKKANQWMGRQQKELAQYIESETNSGRPEKMCKKLQAYVDGTGPSGGAMAGLLYLASYEGAAGCLAVLEQNEEGFARIDLACAYHYWLVRVFVRVYERDKGAIASRVLMSNVATTWMHAAALANQEITDWLSARARRADEGDASLGATDMNPLCGLMGHLVTGKSPDELKASGWAPLGPYLPVVQGPLTADVYDSLADYHTRRLDGAGFPDFQMSPYRYVPFEILAIARLKGGDLENAKHPLLTSGLAKRREVPQMPLTGDASAVIAKVRGELGI